jgi:segregation and condensation protein A
MKAFEKVLIKLQQRNNKPVHTVVRYNYTMEESREYLLDTCKKEKAVSFERLFDICENRIHAIFVFLCLLELIKDRFMTIITGEGRNNFIVEYNEEAPAEYVDTGAYESTVALS